MLLLLRFLHFLRFSKSKSRDFCVFCRVSYVFSNYAISHRVHQCIAWYARLLSSFRWYSLTDSVGMAHYVGVGTQQPRAGFEPTTSRSQVRHRTTRPLVRHVNNISGLHVHGFFELPKLIFSHLSLYNHNLRFH